MDAVCEECGDAGVRELLLRCSKCNSAARHRYCLDTVIFDLVVEWSCSGCIPKHNEAIESLEDTSNQRQLSTTKLGCSMINEPTMDNRKITKARGIRSTRPHRKRKDYVDGSTKHFPSGDTFNWGQWRNALHKVTRDSSDAIAAQFCSGDALDSCEVFIGDIPNNNDHEKEGEDRNGHLICADSSSNLPLDHASDFEPNNLQKAMDGSKLASDSTERTDLSNARTGCFASSKYVEGLVPPGRKGDIYSLTNDVEASLPKILEKSCPTSASVEQARLSINREKSEPLKAVIGLEKSAAASKFAPNLSKPIQGSDLKTGNADVLNPLNHCFNSCSMVPMQTSPSNELEDVSVQENSAERTRCLVDEETNAPLEKSAAASKFAPNLSKPIQGSDLKTGNADVLNPLNHCFDSCSMVPMQTSPSNELEDVSVQENSAERTRCLVDEETNAPLEKSAAASKFAPNRSKPIQGSDLKTGNADVLNPLNHCLDSCSMVPMQTSPSNELEDVSVQESSAERTRCLVDEETNAPPMGNLKVSKPSMANECLVSNEGNSDNRRSDEVLSSTKARKITMRTSGDREIVNSYKINVISNPESAKGDGDAKNLRRNPRRNAGKPSSLDVKKVFLKPVLQEEGINSELLSSGFVGPCESTKINPRKRKQSESHTPDGTKCHKAAIINEIKIINDAQLKGGRPAPASSVRDQNMSREDNGAGNLNHQCSKNHKEVKKRSMGANKDVNVSQLTLQTVVKEGYCGISRMPPISGCIDMQPFDEPYWTGIMKIDENYISLAAHLSTKASKKVQEQSRSLPKIMKVTELSASKTCPKHLETPIPSADSIGVYFFSSDMRSNEELDQLVKHVADSGIILEAIVGLAKLFLFPSIVLPEGYQRFQGKPFLWGVFKPRKEKIKRLAPVEQDCVAHITKNDHVQEQHVLDQQDKAQGVALDQVVHPENQPLLDANQEVGKEALSGNGLPLVDMKAIVSANISAVDQGQPCSNPEAPPRKICGFVVSRTPKSAQLIQEMQKEGALLFAVQQVMTEPGSVV